jgi:hypothetical protein
MKIGYLPNIIQIVSVDIINEFSQVEEMQFNSIIRPIQYLQAFPKIFEKRIEVNHYQCSSLVDGIRDEPVEHR